MKIQIDDRAIVYGKHDNREKLVNLMLENRALLELIDNINLNQEMLDEEGDSISEDVWDMSIGSMFGRVGKDVLLEFKKLWSDMNAENKGKVLERLVSRLGAYYFVHTNKYTNDARVYSIHNGTTVYNVTRENDFDVIFYPEDQTVIVSKGKIDVGAQMGIEFHEAKKNINNELPADEKGKIRDRMQRKLDFMKEVYTNYSQGKYYIPTFSTQVEKSEDCLQSRGYGFIEVISIKEIVNKYA